MARSITKIQAVILVVAVLIALIAAIVLYVGVGEAPRPSPTPTPSPTPSPTPPQRVTIRIGNVTLTVSSSFKEFVDKAKNGEVSVSIHFGHALAEHERPAFQRVIEMFEREYPGIDVKDMPYASMDILKSQISAIAALPPEQREQHVGRVPDVFTWAHDWIGSFAETGYIVPLEEVIESEAIINEISPELLPIALASVTYKLKTYGLPYAAEAIALIINKNLVNDTPESFDEMKAIMQQFHDPGNEKFGLAYQFDPYHVYPFVTAFGGYYYDEAKGGVEGMGVNTTGTKRGVEFYVRNVLPYLDYSDLGGTHQLNLFTSGRAPMIITGPWNLAAINKSIGLKNVVVIPIPSIGDKVPKPFSGFRNMYITIMAKTGGIERLYATVLLVLYICLNDEAIRVLVEENNYVPVKNSVVSYVQENRERLSIVHGFLQQVFRSIPMPKDPLMDKAWGVGTYLNAILTEYSTALAQGKSVEEAIEAAAAVISSRLDEAYATIVQSIRSS